MKNIADPNFKEECIDFHDDEHKKFYNDKIEYVSDPDVYYCSLVYILGISDITREFFDQIFDIKKGLIKPECLDKAWQTGNTLRTVRLAFNLYTNRIPESDFQNAQYYSASDIFCSSYAPYYWQGIKLRYPEYCNKLSKEVLEMFR